MSEPKQLALVRDYDGLLTVLRQRAADLQVSRETLDSVSGLQPGYSAKLLSPVPARSLGRVSFGPLLQSLGLAIVVVEDLDALSRVQNRFGTPERNTMHGDGAHDVITMQITRRRLAMLARKGGKKCAEKLTPKQRQRNARRAARARWRRLSQCQNVR